jgi:hypothetical protein
MPEAEIKAIAYTELFLPSFFESKISLSITDLIEIGLFQCD